MITDVSEVDGSSAAVTSQVPHRFSLGRKRVDFSKLDFKGKNKYIGMLRKVRYEALYCLLKCLFT